MENYLEELIVMVFPTLWAICASIYIIFSEREKRLFLEWASVFRPWLVLPIAIYAWALMGLTAFTSIEISSGAMPFVMMFVMASPILALAYGRHSSIASEQVRQKADIRKMQSKTAR